MKALSAKKLIVLASTIGGSLASSPVLAGTSGNQDFSAEVSIGGEYDSNVSVDAVDATTASGDASALLDADLGFRTNVGNGTSLRLGYAFSQSLHEKFTDFDLQTHIGSVDLSHDFGSATAGASYRFIDTSLGGNAFLRMHQASPYLSFMVSKTIMLRGDYTYTRKNLIGRVDRDATNNAGSLDAYYFMNGSRTVFLAGYKYARENARDAQFDYKAHTFRLRVSQKFDVGSNSGSVRLGWRHEDRDYSGISPSIGARRSDRKNRLLGEVELPISQTFFVTGEYEHGNYKSNLPSAQYRQDVATLKLGARF